MGDTLDDTGADERLRSARTAQALPLLFVVVDGAHPAAGGSRHVLSHIDEVIVGRGEEPRSRRERERGRSRLHLELPDPRVSSTHARLVRKGSAFILEDAGSRNGTRVNGSPAAGEELEDGDLIEVGRTVLRYRTELPVPADAPADVSSRDLREAAPGMATLIPAFEESNRALMRIARSEITVLLRGETGTGKEVLARAIHALSNRQGSFVAMNCGAIPETLVESQLFGHVKGAFSGAAQDELGFVRSADGGTLFLDEIGDLPRSSQAKLLRVLQEREVVPLGASRGQKVDLRVITATHLPIEEMVARGEFREDLYARLAGYVHTLPPLRERREDLGLLLSSLLARLVTDSAAMPIFSAELSRALIEHDWPRNIRELEQWVSVTAVLSPGAKLELQHAPEPARQPAPAKREAPLEGEQLERELRAAFEKHGGNVSHVAKSMGKARSQVQRWMKRFKIDPRSFRSS